MVWHPIRRQNQSFYKCLSVLLPFSLVFVVLLRHRFVRCETSMRVARYSCGNACYSQADLSVVDRRKRLLPLMLHLPMEDHLRNVATKEMQERGAVEHSVRPSAWNAETGHSSTLQPLACRRVHALCKRRRH